MKLFHVFNTRFHSFLKQRKNSFFNIKTTRDIVVNSAIIGLFVGILFFIPTVLVHGETVAELQEKISAWNTQIASLEAEIAQYEEDLAKIGSDRKTLESEIARLDLSRKKIATDIAVTQNRISATGLELEDLGIQIEDKARRVTEGKQAIRRALQSISRIDDVPVAEYFFSATTFSDAWKDIDNLQRIQTALNQEVATLEIVQEALKGNYQDVSLKQGELISFSRQLTGQRSVLDQTRKSQSTILTRTKSEEAEYQRLLKEKQDAREQLEDDLRSFEAELQYTLNPSSLPSTGSGVLKFPLDPTFMNGCKDRQKTFGNMYCVTQYFGNTAFAQSGAYSGKGHNGMDFGASTGTMVVSSFSGIVEAVGNTDTAKGCYSYGKWVLVRHPNGLSTLYAHLSVISVAKGEAVATGGLVGYSGSTGYSTGPHLHFTVFASDGVEVRNLRDWYVANGRSPSTGCAKGGVSIPVAGTQAYLNPLDYL